jgi:protein-L-isoaspartate(D-aspartate) O-methyltransferase
LEIGTGSGYQAALLSRLAKKIITVERVKELADRTKKLLQKQGFANIEVVFGNGTKGCAAKAPFDAIIITAAASSVPKQLIEQLADGGRLVAPIGPSHHQELVRIKKRNNELEEDYHGGVIFVPLISDD